MDPRDEAAGDGGRELRSGRAVAGRGEGRPGTVRHERPLDGPAGQGAAERPDPARRADVRRRAEPDAVPDREEEASEEPEPPGGGAPPGAGAPDEAGAFGTVAGDGAD